MSNLRATMGLSSVLLLVGCGGSSGDDTPPEGTTTGGGEGRSDTRESVDVAWVDMDRPQRLVFMRDTVMPEMRALFQEHDAERFADFECATCHGANMEEVDFSMPNGVAPLDPAQLGAIFQSEQPMAVFMVQRAWPRMVELLQAQPYDPATNEGFGCMGCHATEGG